MQQRTEPKITQHRRNVRLALILASIAVTIFIGFIFKWAWLANAG